MWKLIINVVDGGTETCGWLVEPVWSRDEGSMYMYICYEYKVIKISIGRIAEFIVHHTTKSVVIVKTLSAFHNLIQ
jgi:hypothetical protein